MEGKGSGHMELPIRTDHVECVTDCWIYNRLVVLGTSPHYRDWIASHYELYSDSGYNFHFGEAGMVAPEYHDTILERRPLHLFGLTRTTVVDLLKEELRKGFYVLMYIKEEPERDHFHEALFYGYDDDREQMLVVGLKGHSFQRFGIPYTWVRKMLPEVQEHFLNSQVTGVELAGYYQYPLTAFRLREDYHTENCVFDAYRKLRGELNGDSFRRWKVFDYGEYQENDVIYRGVNCLYSYGKMLEQEIGGQPFPDSFRGLASAAKKINEHQRMVRHSMEYVVEKWEYAVNEKGYERLADYQKCCDVTEKWMYLVLKYMQTGKKGLLERIVAEIPDIFQRERWDLYAFSYLGLDWERFYEKYM